MPSTVRITWARGEEVTGRLAGDGPVGVLLAHGAGTDQDHPLIVAIRDGLASRGLRVLTFNYPYTERGGKRPDPRARLLDCHRAAADRLGRSVDLLYMAGRSMGGRMGSYLVADGYPAAGLVFYSYPLHPAGRTDRLRVEQFASIRVPMLFFQGTHDALARMDLFEEHIARLPGATVEIMEGAAHSPGRGGWTVPRMADHLAGRTARWIQYSRP
ncbi:MAG: dienelactone hydrolase [Actinomycetes bacterium]|jgi:predicted alpha/beta-hydrolase family hydrolase|nr:MAG: dienelactone hydrolase [Actinomycetota bacterium]